VAAPELLETFSLSRSVFRSTDDARHISRELKLSVHLLEQRVTADGWIQLHRCKDGAVSDENQIHREHSTDYHDDGHPDDVEVVENVRHEEVCVFLQRHNLQSFVNVKVCLPTFITPMRKKKLKMKYEMSTSIRMPLIAMF
jgi:hypothetical protein